MKNSDKSVGTNSSQAKAGAESLFVAPVTATVAAQQPTQKPKPTATATKGRTYADLVREREHLESEIAAARKAEIAAAAADIRAVLDSYSLVLNDVLPLLTAPVKTGKSTRAKAEPKYMNPKTGDTWTGRGKPPKWIALVDDRSKFLIK